MDSDYKFKIILTGSTGLFGYFKSPAYLKGARYTNCGSGLQPRSYKFAATSRYQGF
ncbi:hypothetical protein D1AOALGA4SA_5863 [Olavius algarvensis Delta 1 endosymbiont]|nr:hypothetical protein D1AOALGA4SA_5863 [Olavius algarvensis Delta 1 endosymbiont]